MTPLAHAIVADSTLTLRKRKHDAAARGLRLLDDVHFFEVSEVFSVAGDLADRMDDSVIVAGQRLAFLPAPRTWIEYAWAGGRIAMLLEQDRDLATVTAVAMRRAGGALRIESDIVRLPLLNSVSLGRVFFAKRTWCSDPSNSGGGIGVFLYAVLSMINTPRVIGRRVHQPHAGLQRKIASAHSMPGKYPLQAWHELVLEVKPPRDESDSDPRQTILTGGKALHFVRAYLRIAGGQLQLVASHWKGDPALGLKQTRYRVIPDRRRAS